MVDGYIVMKSTTPFKVGQIFGGAFSSMLGMVNAHMVVAGVSDAKEAQAQAKRIANLNLRPADMSYRYYYRVAPQDQKWSPWFQ